MAVAGKKPQQLCFIQLNKTPESSVALACVGSVSMQDVCVIVALNGEIELRKT